MKKITLDYYELQSIQLIKVIIAITLPIILFATVVGYAEADCGLTPASACQYSYDMTPISLDLDSLQSTGAVTIE